MHNWKSPHFHKYGVSKCECKKVVTYILGKIEFPTDIKIQVEMHNSNSRSSLSSSQSIFMIRVNGSQLANMKKFIPTISLP